MSEQALGQILVIIGFIAWAAAIMGLCLMACLAARRRRWWATTSAIVPTLALFAAGVGAFATIPGSMQ